MQRPAIAHDQFAQKHAVQNRAEAGADRPGPVHDLCRRDLGLADPAPERQDAKAARRSALTVPSPGVGPPRTAPSSTADTSIAIASSQTSVPANNVSWYRHR